MVKNGKGDVGSIPGEGKIPWRTAWQPTPVFFPGGSYGQRSLLGYGPEKPGKLEVGGASRDSTGLGALEEGLISS